MKVTQIKYADAKDEGYYEQFSQSYISHDAPVLREVLAPQISSDFMGECKERISYDNGKTWSEWTPTSTQTTTQTQGENERQTWDNAPDVWNPVHRHHVRLATDTIYLGGHEKAYHASWRYCDDSLLAQHAYLVVTNEADEKTISMVKYEDGSEFDPENWGNPDFFRHNIGCDTAGGIIAEPDGNILFAFCAPVASCCRLGGYDVNEIFPSYPESKYGVIVFRGIWNGERYDTIPGRPIVISDRLAALGLNEPTLAKLANGRILVVMRGTNACAPTWTRKRIEPGTPGVKWYAYSDDNGKTFTDPMPWHFDTGEFVYSSATYSTLIQDARSGKHYWIGNITDPVKTEGSFPRFPLQIVEVDETYGTAKKDTVTVIDTKRDWESEFVQLSNFNVLQKRETGTIEIMLTKFGQFQYDPSVPPIMKGEAWKYEIELD